MLGKGESLATEFIDHLFRKLDALERERGKKKTVCQQRLENLREIKYLHTLIT